MSPSTFKEVTDFTADLKTSLDRCDNGEGARCATLELSLQHHAEVCLQFYDAIRQWGRDVFSGRAPSAPDVEKAWLAAGSNLYRRLSELYGRAEKAEAPCFELDGLRLLGFALLRLHRLLTEWVSPERAVGPSARLRGDVGPDGRVGVLQRIEELPPLPAGWVPSDPGQRALYQRLQNS